MNIYLAGPMRGIPEFNFPMFKAVSARLRQDGHVVFSPAEKDIERMGTDFSKNYPTGDEAAATKDTGFNLREALADDMEYICRKADAVVLLPGWESSKGANAERATALALGLRVLEYGKDL